MGDDPVHKWESMSSFWKLDGSCILRALFQADVIVERLH